MRQKIKINVPVPPEYKVTAINVICDVYDNCNQVNASARDKFTIRQMLHIFNFSRNGTPIYFPHLRF